MHPRSPPNSSWLLSYCLLSAWWRALLGPCRRSRWSFSVHLKVNNSATKTSLAMISDAYESPSHRLSHAVPLVSRFKVKYVPVQIFPPFMKTSKLPVHSTLYNSATRTSLAMILDSYESPTSGLSYRRRTLKASPKFTTQISILAFVPEAQRSFTHTWQESNMGNLVPCSPRRRM